MPKAPTGRRRYLTAAQWQTLFQRFETSGAGVAAFCRRESISASSFYRWRQKLAGTPTERPESTSAKSAFIDAGALSDEQIPVVSAWDVKLDLGRGVVLRLRRG